MDTKSQVRRINIYVEKLTISFTLRKSCELRKML